MLQAAMPQQATAVPCRLSADVIGVEICGSLKNVLAIAAGIVEGLELGPNAMAAMIAQARACPAASPLG